MYVKFVITESGENRKNGCLPASGHTGCTVVPSSSKVFECEAVYYSKYAVNSLDEFVKMLEHKPHTTVCAETGIPERPFEFLYAVVKPDLHDSNTWKEYAVVDCRMFIMNEVGKTIDFVGCGYPSRGVFDTIQNPR